MTDHTNTPCIIARPRKGSDLLLVAETVLLGHGIARLEVTMPDGTVRKYTLMADGATSDPLLNNYARN